MGDVNIFVNEFITLGMQDYLNQNEVSFERHIIECLMDIYGEQELKDAYRSGNQQAFYSLIMKYGVKDDVFENFLNNTSKYEEFKKENAANPALKSDIACIVEIDIIMMFLYKSLVESPSIQELSHFENDLLNDFNMIKLHFNTCVNPNRTRDYWTKKKKILNDSVELIEIKPTYLDGTVYAKYGVNIDDVKKMDYRMVEELNSYIRVNAESLEKEDTKNTSIWNTAISSGSGFVDVLLILGVIATELSLGVIYLFLHM